MATTAAYGTETTVIAGRSGYPDYYGGNTVSDKWGFYGVTPVVQASGGAQAAVTTAAPTVTAFGFTLPQATALLNLTNAMRDALVNIGIMKGSA